jgi:hypothetical protein
MDGEPCNKIELSSLSIEEGPAYLCCEAKPLPLWPVLFCGAGVALVILLPATMIFQQFIAPRSNNRPDAADVGALAAVLILTIATLIIFAMSVIRNRRPRRLTIENGELLLLTPEQPVNEHRIASVDIKAATLRGGRTNGKKDTLSTLVLLRHRGRSLTGFAGMPSKDLAHVVDAVNRFVRIDQFKAFEVVVPAQGEPNAPAAVLSVEPLRVLPVDAPLRVLPVEPEQQ